MDQDRIICHMRHKENGNCLPLGGFCTSVSDEICHALHNAYMRGERDEDINARLIEAADAIDELQYTVQAQDKALKFCADQLARRWTPVTERLPTCEWGAEVGNIEWISCGMVFAGCFGRGGKYRDAYFRTWTDGTQGIDAKDADYWRPIQIPEPPKDGEP